VSDSVDILLNEWADERPDLDTTALGIVVRVQLVAKLLADSAERALARFGLKHWEYDVLSALRRQGDPPQLSASDLARESMLTSGTITTRIDGLEKRGFVERHPDPDDRRAISVRLTTAGRATIEEAIAVRVQVAEDQLALLSGTERDSLSAALRKVLMAMADRKDAA